MKKYLLSLVGLIFALGLGFGVAQNINKALQLSQDATGAFGVDASNNIYFPAHTISNIPRTPTLSSCGTSSSITGTDEAGTVTVGSAAGGGTSGNGCPLTFSTAYVNAPACQVTPTTATPVGATATAGGFTIATTASPSGLVYNYLCRGVRG